MWEPLHQMGSEFGFELRLRPLSVPYYACPICSKLKYTWKEDVGSINWIKGELLISSEVRPSTYTCRAPTQYILHKPSIRSQILLEKCHTLLKSSLLPSFDLRVTQITSHSESVWAAIEIFPHITRCKLSSAEDLIRLCLCRGWELTICGARVEEERSFRSVEIFLEESSKTNW